MDPQGGFSGLLKPPCGGIPAAMRVFAIFALGMLVGLVAGYLAGKSSAGNSSRTRSDNKNPWA
jgi:hypothetical protein